MKRLLLFLLFLVPTTLFAQGGMGPGPGTAHSAGGGGGSVTFDALSTGTLDFVTSITVSHTVASQSNRYLVVGIAVRNDIVSGVTYDSVAMSLITSKTDQNSRVFLYGLVAPNTGTHNIVVTLAGAAQVSVAGMSAYNVNQTTPYTNTATATNAGSTSPSITVTSSTSDLAFTMLSWQASGGSANTPDATWTAATAGTQSFLGGQGAYKAGAATVTRTDSLSVSQNWTMAGVSLAP